MVKFRNGEKVIMKQLYFRIFRAIVILLLLLSMASCSSLGRSQSMIAGLSKHVKREDGLFPSCYITSYKEGKLSIDYLVDVKPSLFSNFTVEESRKIYINTYLSTLNYLYTHPQYENLTENENFTSRFGLTMFFGNETRNESASYSNGEDDCGVIKLFLPDNLGYFHPHDISPFLKETLAEAIEILRNTNEIEHPEYLKWLDAEK